MSEPFCFLCPTKNRGPIPASHQPVAKATVLLLSPVPWATSSVPYALLEFLFSPFLPREPPVTTSVQWHKVASQKQRFHTRIVFWTSCKRGVSV